MSQSCVIAFIWMSLDLTDDESTLVQVMAWYHQATRHYLRQYWPRSMSPFGVTRPQWVNSQKFSKTFNPCDSEFFLENNEYIFDILHNFLDADLLQTVEIQSHGKPEYPQYTQSISWLLMTWRLMEPGHQQAHGTCIDLAVQWYSGFSTRKINTSRPEQNGCRLQTFSNNFFSVQNFWFRLQFHWCVFCSVAIDNLSSLV